MLPTLLKMLMNKFSHQPEILGCHCFYLFQAGNNSAYGGSFPDQEQRIPEKPELREVALP
jgi:hypothetical protein